MADVCSSISCSRPFTIRSTSWRRMTTELIAEYGPEGIAPFFAENPGHSAVIL